MRCKNCGAEIPDGAYFCSECGAVTTPETDKTNNTDGFSGGYVPPVPPKATMSCPQCGNPVTADDDFCPQCGVSLKKNIYTTDRTAAGGNNRVLIAIIAVLAVIAIASAAVAAAVLYRPEPEPAPTPYDIPTLTPVSSPTPTPIPTPTPTPTPTSAPKQRYEVVISHITWEEARNTAERRGGHLVTIQNQQEFNDIVYLLSGSAYSKVKNVWIGACAPPGINSKTDAEAYWNSPQASWITGEPFTFTKWRSGEPSGYDDKLASPERYLQIFRPAADGGAWSYNDAGDDLSEYKENTLAYIIEYE